MSYTLTSLLMRIQILFLRTRRLLRRTSLISWLLILLFIAFVFSAFYGAQFLTTLIYDDEVAKAINRNTLISLIAVPGILVVTSLAILIRILIERIRREPGTSLRFKIIVFFGTAMLLPAVIFSFFFVNIFDFTINKVLTNQLFVKNLEDDLTRYQAEILRLQKINEQEFLSQYPNEQWNFPSKTDIDLMMTLNSQNTPIRIQRRPGLTLNNYPAFDLSKEFPQNLNPNPSATQIFSSYSQEAGFVYTLYRDHQHGGTQVAISFIPEEIKNEITSVLEVTRQFQQFILLAQPFKSLSLSLLVYLYIQIFSLTVILFYYSSNKYLIPIGDLIRTLQKFPQETFEQTEPRADMLKRESRLDKEINRLRGTEVGDLLQAFQSMRRQLRRNQMRLVEILELKGWKEAATRLAHEIKNPLTPILLSLHAIRDSLIRHDFTLYEEFHEEFTLIEGEIKRITAMINEFAAFSKESSLEYTQFSPQVLFKKLQRHFRSYKNIQFDLEFAGSKKIYADKNKFYQVILNLTQNAVDALKSQRKQRQKNLKIIAHDLVIEERKYYQIQILNNGPSIPPEQGPLLFKPYVTYKKTGMGLGLTICRQIALAHGGDVFILPQRDFPKEITNQDWTIFVFRIPILSPKDISSQTKTTPVTLG